MYHGLKYNGNFITGIFDLDGNILHAQTPLYYKDKRSGLIVTFLASYIESRPELFFGEQARYAETSHTYDNFLDVSHTPGHRSFLGMEEDFRHAIENNNFAPSFYVFKNMFLIKGRIFHILTARGNSADNLEKCIGVTNHEVLTQSEKEEQHENIIKNYGLDPKISHSEAWSWYTRNVVNFVTTGNPNVEKMMNLQQLSTAQRKAKMIPILLRNSVQTLQHITQTSITELLSPQTKLSVGFSDDSVANIQQVGNTFQELITQQPYGPHVYYSAFFSGNPGKYHEVLSHLQKTGSVTSHIKNIPNTDMTKLDIRFH